MNDSKTGKHEIGENGLGGLAGHGSRPCLDVSTLIRVQEIVFLVKQNVLLKKQFEREPNSQNLTSGRRKRRSTISIDRVFGFNQLYGNVP